MPTNEELFLAQMGIQPQQNASTYDLQNVIQSMTPAAPTAVSMETRTKQRAPMQDIAGPVMQIAAPKTAMSADTFAEMIKRQTQGLEQQREGLGQFDKQLAQINATQPSQAAQAFAALSDMMNGGNMFQTAKAAEAQGRKQAQDLAQNVQKYKNDLTDKEIDLLKAQFQNSSDQEKMAMMERMNYAKISADQREKEDKSGKDILKTKEAQDIQSKIDLSDALTNYQSLVDTHGYNVTGKNKTEIENAYADLKIKYKEAANLGALTGPDVKIIEEAIKPITGFGGAMGQAGGALGLSGGAEGISTAISKARGTVDKSFKNKINTLRSAYGDSPVLTQWESRFNRGGKTVGSDKEMAEYEALQKKAGRK